MSDIWRALDTGLRAGAQNTALDRALLEARAADEIPSTLRFYRNAPAASLRALQSAAQEFDLEFCRSQDLAIERRIINGAAHYIDQGQLGWQLYVSRTELGTLDTRASVKRIGHAAAAAISVLGVDASVRANGDVAVDGRVVCMTGFAVEGEAIAFDGLVLVDGDLDRMRSVLNPLERFKYDATGPGEERLTTLRKLLRRRPAGELLKRKLTEAFESEFDIEFEESDISLSEHARYRAALAEIEVPAWARIVERPPGEIRFAEATLELLHAALNLRVSYDSVSRRIRHILFESTPRLRRASALSDIEAALEGTPIERFEHTLRRACAARARVAPLTVDDFVAVMRKALKFPLVAPTPAASQRGVRGEA